jgi:cell division protein FtsX
MFTFLLSLIVISLAFVGGFYAGIKNANSQKVSWGKEMLNKLKSKD